MTYIAFSELSIKITFYTAHEWLSLPLLKIGEWAIPFGKLSDLNRTQVSSYFDTFCPPENEGTSFAEKMEL